MAEVSKISWTDATFNPWIGCTKVGPACDGCYAENLMGTPGRFGPARVTWGKPGQKATYSRTSESYWKEPLRWNRKQAKLWAEYDLACARGEKVAPPAPFFVFCASLADIFDNQVDPQWRKDLFELIRATPHLTWLLLTKRPQNIVSLYMQTGGPTSNTELNWPFNAAIMCTVVTQQEADRDIPHLLRAKVRLRPAFAGVSMEPLLEAVNIHGYLKFSTGVHAAEEQLACLDWVITGGETDQGAWKARPSNPAWFRNLRDQCIEAGVAYQHKQNGEWTTREQMNLAGNFDPGPDRYTTFGNAPGVKFERWGKDAAGRCLDGIEHNDRPIPRAA